MRFGVDGISVVFPLAHRYRSAPAVRFGQTKVLSSFRYMTAFPSRRGVTLRRPLSLRPLRKMRPYPRKYDELSANSVNVTFALPRKKSARTSETSRVYILSLRTQASPKQPSRIVREGGEHKARQCGCEPGESKVCIRRAGFICSVSSLTHPVRRSCLRHFCGAPPSLTNQGRL